MKKGLSKFNLTSKITLVVFFMVILAVGFSAFFSVRKLTSTVTGLMHKDASTIAAYVESEIENLLLPKISLVETLATTQSVKTFVFDRVFAPASKVLETNSDITKLYLVNASEYSYLEVARSGDRIYQDISSNAFNAKDQAWFQETLNMQKTVFTSPQKTGGSDSLSFTISTPVRDDSGKIVGVIAVDISLDRFYDLMKSIIVGKNGYAMVIDKSGAILYHPDESRLLENTTAYEDNRGRVITKMLRGETGTGEIELSGERYYAYYTPITIADWSVAAVIPSSEFSQTAYEAITSVLITSIVILTISSLLIVPFIKSMVKPLLLMLNQLEEIASGQGDLTKRLKVKSNDEIGMLASSFNNFMDKLSSLFHEVQQSAVSVLEGTKQLFLATEQQAKTNEQIALVIEQVAEGSQNQSQDIHHAREAVNQLVSGIEQIASGAQNQAVHTNQVVQLTQSMIKILNTGISSVENITVKEKNNIQQATQGLEIVNLVAENIVQIQSEVDETLKNSALLKEGSNQIGAIVQVINEVADQTNLLALNAAIEAARAGEHGKGFAVVADEVRTLSDRVRTSSNEIGSIIQKLIITISDTLQSINRSTDIINRGGELTKKAQTALNSIVNSATESGLALEELSELNKNLIATSKQVEEAMTTIIAIAEENSASTEEMSASSSEVLRLIEAVESVSAENAASSEEVAASAEEQSATSEEVASQAGALRNIAENLGNLVANFKTEDNLRESEDTLIRKTLFAN